MDRQSQQQPWKVRIFDIFIRLWKFGWADSLGGGGRISGGIPPGYMRRINSGCFALCQSLCKVCSLMSVYIKRWCCLTSVWLTMWRPTSVWRLTSVAYIQSAGGVCGRPAGIDWYWLIGPGSAGLAQGCRCALPLQAWAGAYRGGRPFTACLLLFYA